VTYKSFKSWLYPRNRIKLPGPRDQIKQLECRTKEQHKLGSLSIRIRKTKKKEKEIEINKQCIIIKSINKYARDCIMKK